MRMACQGIKINKILAFDMIPGISWDYKPQIPLPVAFSYSRSLPVKREWDFQFPFPFPGALKPFPLTPVSSATYPYEFLGQRLCKEHSERICL